jgi:hypothetical protein
MPRFTNLKRVGFTILELNSGERLYIPPLKTSPEIAELEVTKNAQVDKLLKRRIIARAEEETPPARSGAPVEERPGEKGSEPAAGKKARK